MSPIYGPFYPPRLQAVVDHAERLAATLAHLRVGRRRDRSGAEAAAWLVGRVSEIETFVAAIVDEQRRLVVDERAAAAAIDGYLDELHRGLRRHFSEAPATLCCVAQEANETTRPLSRTASRA